VAPSRLNAILFGSFALLALLIAAVGVLTTLAFSVNQRVREFGIRMAIGADRGSVLRNVLGEGPSWSASHSCSVPRPRCSSGAPSRASSSVSNRWIRFPSPPPR
jgi:hypothetical protein